MVGEVKSTYISDCTDRNFPIKAFYSPVTNEVYTFFRQG